MEELKNKHVYLPGFTISYNICLVYEKLKRSRQDNIDETEKLYRFIEDLIKAENIAYNKLTLNEVESYLKEIDNLENSQDELVIRYKDKLMNRKIDLLSKENPVMKYLKVDSGVFSLININAIILIYQKLKSISKMHLSINDQEFLNNMFSSFNVLKYTKLAPDKLTEEFALSQRYNFDIIKPINLKKIPKIESINSICVPMATNAIHKIISSHKKEKTPNNILYSLYYINILEIALSIADIASLKKIVTYCNEALTSPKDYQLEAGSIRRLIYKRKDELGI